MDTQNVLTPGPHICMTSYGVTTLYYICMCLSLYLFASLQSLFKDSNVSTNRTNRALIVMKTIPRSVD